MSNKNHAEIAHYREEVARQFLSKCERLLPQDQSRSTVAELYKAIHDPIAEEVKKLDTYTLAKIIEATPRVGPGVTPLLYPRHTQRGLESLNYLGLSGRDYLEVMAVCAIVGAVFDYSNRFRMLESPSLQM